jgi:spore coat protein CotH
MIFGLITLGTGNHKAHEMKRYLATLTLLLVSMNLNASDHTGTSTPAADGLFAPNHLIQVEVKMAPEDWQTLRISHRVTGEDFSKIVEKPYEYYPADVVIDGREIKSVGIRKKGFFGSAISTRPSLKLKLDKYVDDQSFGGQDMLTFNNNNQDPTQAQSFLVYTFMNKAGAKSPRSNFARIIVNGEDLGVYTHVESVRKPLVKRLFNNSNGDLWEGYAGDFTSTEYNRIVHKWGKDEESKKLQQLYDLLQSPDPIPLDEFEKLLDLDAFITLWASEVLIGHWDGYASNRNNFYIYLEPESDRFYFMPWGPDSAFWDPGPFLPENLPKSFKARGYLCERLWELPAVRTRYRAELQRLLNEVWDEEKMLTDLKQAHALTQNYTTVASRAVEQGSLSIRKYIGTRRGEVQAELDQPATDWPGLGGDPEPGAAAVLEVSGEFSSVFQVPAEQPAGEGESESPGLFALTPASLLGTGSASIEFTIDGEPHKPFTQYGVRTTPGNPDFIRKGYPVIDLIASSESGHPPWRLTLIMDPYQLVEGRNELEVDHFTVWAQLTQGEPGTPGLQTKAFGISGTLELDSYSSEPGAAVSGRFQLKTSAFGGEH